MADHLSRLLQTKAGIEPVTPELIAAAEKLRSLKLLSYERRSFVRCAFTEDRDFPRTNRTCTGRLFLAPHLDENGRDYRCPDCGRTMYPMRDCKRQFEELRVKVLEEGVSRYVAALLGKVNGESEAVDGASFAWRVKIGLTGVYVCIADYCDHQRLMSIQWAQQNPTCYVHVNPKAIQRFADVDWICKAPLSDLVAGRMDLSATVRSLAANNEGRPVPALATPAYSKGAHRPERLVPPYEASTGLFVLEIGKKTVRINDVEVVAAQARTTHRIVSQLAKAYIEDVLRGTAPNDYYCQTPAEIADAQKLGGDKEVFEHEQVRRTINRLQENIEERLNRAGVVAERGSVIQASPNEAKEGYRLNPFKVAIRPLIPQNDEN